MLPLKQKSNIQTEKIHVKNYDRLINNYHNEDNYTAKII